MDAQLKVPGGNYFEGYHVFLGQDSRRIYLSPKSKTPVIFNLDVPFSESDVLVQQCFAFLFAPIYGQSFLQKHLFGGDLKGDLDCISHKTYFLILETWMCSFTHHTHDSGMPIMKQLLGTQW